MFKSLHKFDAFPKIERNIQHATRTGGLLTLLVACALLFLVMSEFSQYATIHQNYEFLVDQSLGSHVQISVDLTIAMKCGDLRSDVLDVSGTSLALQHEFTATPVKFHTRGVRQLSSSNSKKDDNFNIHRLVAGAGWESGGERVEVGDDACRIRGNVNVNKVSGMLHFTALGHGHMDAAHVAHEAMNFSHRIDRLSFGIFYPGLVNPLDHSLEMASAPLEIFQYFVSVVPTIYVDQNRAFGSKFILTNQYAVTDYYRVIDVDKGGVGVPGIFLKYDIEPIAVRVTEARSSFLHFLTRLCGIVGGVFVSVGLLNNLLQFAQGLISKKQ
ncbi:endoplasmic reticulum vesicle transporter-domain-containing protein [Zopfochytrium polystomum]|nr:endoplasmic reticulum vesicle transporter-domain-containing protein [Zopfochytrium polystomum]